jgi:Predicted transcriptional regulators
MNVKIGERIKFLRKRDDLTQENLADAIGVTSQAVSKWESGGSYPDIEYITPIAAFFNVTTDYLFSYDTAEKQKKIEEYCAAYDNHHRDWKPAQERVDMMRDALAQFPAEEKLLFKLAEALYYKSEERGHSSTHRDGYVYYVYEDYRMIDCLDEAVKIMEELLQSSSDDAIRGHCRWFLAHVYARAGEKGKALAIAEKCGDIFYSKLSILASALDGEDEIKYQQDLNLSLLCSFRRSFSSLTRSQVTDMGVKIKADKIMIDLFEFVFSDGNCGFYHIVIRDLYVDHAMRLATADRFDESFAALDRAFDHSLSFDEIVFARDGSRRDEVMHFTSPYVSLLDGENPKLFYTVKQLQNLLDSIMDERDTFYKKLSGDARYGALIEKIKAAEF